MISTIFSHFYSDESSHQHFLQHCNDMLRVIDPSGKASFEDDVWVIPFSRAIEDKNNNLYATLNFTDFKSKSLKYTEQHVVKLEKGKSVVLNTLGFAKWIFLKLRSDLAVDYRSVWFLDVLKMHFTFLNERRSTVLGEEDLEEFFSLLLTHDFKNGSFVKRFAAPAYNSRFRSINLMASARILRSYGIDDFVGEFSQADINKAFNEACLAQIDMTLSDYKAGGTFDFLTLDVGRHYVDHCAEFFEENIVLSTALSNALSEIGLKANIEGKKEAWKSHLDATNILSKSSILVQKFKRQYNDIVECTSAFRLSTISKIALELGLEEERFDTYEFIRSLLFARFYATDLKKRELILVEYLDSLKGESSETAINFSLNQFDQVCNSILSNLQLDESNAAETLVSYVTKFKLVNRKSVEKHFLDIEAAGITALVAFTGWRASEYGFPLSALKSDVNRDIKDAVYTPFRFHLKWISPKTNGETLLEREITLSSCILIRQLNALTLHEQNGFAISSKSRESASDISRIVYNAVTRLWLNFPFQYQPFIELTELQKFDKSSDLRSAAEERRFLELSNKYNLENRLVKELLELRDKLIHDVKLQSLVRREHNIGGSTVRFKEIISQYIDGTLPTEDIILLEMKLSQDTLHTIKSNDFVLTQAAVNTIKNELLSDTYYATPHALRHIWAEAVLRRYKGDVGKFIRANFKHIDERFFMAYLRNKEARSIMQVAKRTTINSIVRNRINSLRDKKRSYSGGFDRFVNKAVSITKVHSNDEYNKLAENIANNRIVDIKTNPWSTCILREGTNASAKCSIDGIPQRYNASPKLCLGCINADIEAGNFNGIVIYLKPDIDACRNPNLPNFIKEPHLNNVRKALKRVVELREGDVEDNRFLPFINYLRETIDLTIRPAENI